MDSSVLLLKKVHTSVSPVLTSVYCAYRLKRFFSLTIIFRSGYCSYRESSLDFASAFAQAAAVQPG
jgi:hypothetical protein